MSRPLRCAVIPSVALMAAGAVVWAQAPAGSQAKSAAAVPTPAFSETVLEITPEALDRLAKALAAEEAARKALAGPAAAARLKPQQTPPKSKKEYQECRQGVMIGPDYARLMQEYDTAVAGQPKDSAAVRSAGSEMMAKLAELIEATCGPDPGRPADQRKVAADVRKAEKTAAESNGFSVRQYAVLKERVTPLCLSDPVPPDPRGLKLKAEGRAFLVYTAAEVAALRPRCDAFLKLLYPDQD